jgi:hypothetical protein
MSQMIQRRYARSIWIGLLAISRRSSAWRTLNCSPGCWAVTRRLREAPPELNKRPPDGDTSGGLLRVGLRELILLDLDTPVIEPALKLVLLRGGADDDCGEQEPQDAVLPLVRERDPLDFRVGADEIGYRVR